MRTYAISFNGNAPESWTHEAVKSDIKYVSTIHHVATFHHEEVETMGRMSREGQSMRLSDGTRVVLVEA